MKYIIILLGLVLAMSKVHAQGYPNTDSLRTYNIKYITNNAATAFTNLRLHTLLRGIIDHIDTARSGGGGAIGIDTLWALNDSTIRYRKNGVFRNTILRGVYDTRRKVDSMYTVNDTTIGFKINGTVRTLVIPGRASTNLANSTLTANDDYTHNWAQKQLYIDSIPRLRLMGYGPDSNFPTNIHTQSFEMNSATNGTPLELKWFLRNLDNNQDSIGFQMLSEKNSTILQHSGNNGNRLTYIDMIGNNANPRTQIATYDGIKSSTLTVGNTTTIAPADNLNLPNLVNRTDTTTYKPIVIDGSGNVHKMVGWPGGSNGIDVFLVAGQSNAQGRGDSSLSPKVVSGTVLQVNNGVISSANSLVGMDIGGVTQASNTGSAWPAFGINYYNNTSRKICFAPSSRGGSAQTTTADVYNSNPGNWDTTGVLFDTAVSHVIGTMTALTNAGFTPVFKGVLWSQGESDARAINGIATTQAEYIAAFRKMIRRFRQQFGATMPFYIFRIGTRTDESDVGYDSVRKAQQLVADTDSLTTIVFYNALDFPARSLMSDVVHYSQIGYNEMGNLGALSVLNNIKNILQPQGQNLYYPYGKLGIGIGLPNFKLEVVGGAKADTLYGGNTSADSLRLMSTSHATKGIIAFGTSGYNESNNRLGIGTISPSAQVHISGNTAANFGLTITNLSASAGSNARFLQQTDASGAASQIVTYGSGSTSTANGANSWLLHTTGANGMKIVGSAGDIVFGGSVFPNTNEYGRYKFSTGRLLLNTATDNTVGQLQVNGKITVATHDIASNSDSGLVRDFTTGEYKVAKINGTADGNGIYGGNGSLPSAVTITGAGNALTLTGTQAVSAAFNVNNTGNGSAGSFTTTGSGISLLSNNSGSGPSIFGSANSGPGGYFTSVTGFPIYGATNPLSTNTSAITFMTARTTSSTAAAGLGDTWTKQLEDDAGNVVDAANFTSSWTSAATGAASAKYTITTRTAGSMTDKFTIKPTGQINILGYGSLTHTGTAVGSLQVESDNDIIVGPLLAAGTYTPALTAEVNITTSSISSCQYMRVGNVITVSGKLTIDYTASGNASVDISLPIASSISNDFEVAGTANTTSTNPGGVITGNTTTNTAMFFINSPTSGGDTFYFTFTYQVL